MTSLKLSMSEYNINTDNSLTLSNTSSNDQAVINCTNNGCNVQYNERQGARQNSRVFNSGNNTGISTRLNGEDLRARDINTGGEVNVNNPLVKSFLDKVSLFTF